MARKVTPQSSSDEETPLNAGIEGHIEVDADFSAFRKNIADQGEYEPFGANTFQPNRQAEEAAESTRQRIIMNQLMEDGVPMVGMPGGRLAPLTAFVGIEKYSYRKGERFMGDPTCLLISPRPKEMYAWPLKDDKRTHALIRAGHYKPVLADELRPDSDEGIEILKWQGRNGKTFEVVCWYGHMLVEMTPYHKGRRYDAPVAEAARLTSRATEAFMASVEKSARAAGGEAKGDYRSYVTKEQA